MKIYLKNHKWNDFEVYHTSHPKHPCDLHASSGGNAMCYSTSCSGSKEKKLFENFCKKNSEIDERNAEIEEEIAAANESADGDGSELGCNYF